MLLWSMVWSLRHYHCWHDLVFVNLPLPLSVTGHYRDDRGWWSRLRSPRLFDHGRRKWTFFIFWNIYLLSLFSSLGAPGGYPVFDGGCSPSTCGTGSGLNPTLVSSPSGVGGGCLFLLLFTPQGVGGGDPRGWGPDQSQSRVGGEPLPEKMGTFQATPGDFFSPPLEEDSWDTYLWSRTSVCHCCFFD